LVARSNEKKLAYKLKGKIMKINQLGILASVFGIVGFTTSSNFTNVSAALSAPASWDYKYTKEAAFYEYKLSDTTEAILTPAYTRTADGVYYNYEATFTVVSGLQITQTFNRSNTSWTGGGTTFWPIDTKIGSNASVGSISKHLFEFDNQTNRNYKLIFDVSSNAPNTSFVQQIYYNTVDYPTYSTALRSSADTLLYFYIPSYTNFQIHKQISSALNYFDAWYLEDLGISEAYGQGENDGYDLGYNQGYYDGENDGYDMGYNQGYYDGEDDGYALGLVDGYDQGATAMLNNGGMFGIMEDVLTGANAIFSIPVFGPTITLGTLALFPLLGVVIFFFKKVIQ
jgi:hypothetical protein